MAELTANTILEVVRAFEEIEFSGKFDAYFEVECTNDFENIERFRYAEKNVALEVAKAMSINYSNVAVHATYTNAYDKTFKKTIYLEECENENIVITENGIEGEEE